MAVPKRKTTPSRRNMRRSHDALKGLNIVVDKDSGEAKLPHQTCISGYYNGRLVKPARDRSKNDAAEAATPDAAA